MSFWYHIYWLRNNKTFPDPITLEAITEGQCRNIPDELTEFYRIMYTGSNNETSKRVERYVVSSAEVNIYKATNG